MGRKLFLYRRDTKVCSFWPELGLFCQLCRPFHQVGVSLPGSTIASLGGPRALCTLHEGNTIGPRLCGCFWLEGDTQGPRCALWTPECWALEVLLIVLWGKRMGLQRFCSKALKMFPTAVGVSQEPPGNQLGSQLWIIRWHQCQANSLVVSLLRGG